MLGGSSLALGTGTQASEQCFHHYVTSFDGGRVVRTYRTNTLKHRLKTWSLGRQVGSECLGHWYATKGDSKVQAVGAADDFDEVRELRLGCHEPVLFDDRSKV